MNDDKLRELWRQQSSESPAPISDEQLMANMKTKMHKFDRDIFWRDVSRTGSLRVYHLLVWGDIFHSYHTASARGLHRTGSQCDFYRARIGAGQTPKQTSGDFRARVSCRGKGESGSPESTPQVGFMVVHFAHLCRRRNFL